MEKATGVPGEMRAMRGGEVVSPARSGRVDARGSGAAGFTDDAAQWLKYACKVALRHGRGLDYDSCVSAGGWALATALRRFQDYGDFRGYLASGAKQTVRSDRKIAFSGGLTAYGNTTASARPVRVSTRIELAHHDRPDAAIDARMMLAWLPPRDAEVVRLHFEGVPWITIAKRTHQRVTNAKAICYAAIDRLRERFAA